MFRLAACNIGWSEQEDEKMYSLLKQLGFSGLEIAPTRLFCENPYEHIADAVRWSRRIIEQYGLSVPSMQSIWYGRTESIFGSDAERSLLIDYSKSAIDFAEKIGCVNLVFGCPKNRAIPPGGDREQAVRFFYTLGEYAAEHHATIAIEANPAIYNTNFLNTTEEALRFIEEVASEGVRLNLDTGSMLANQETVEVLEGKEHLIHHVHISEPLLKTIQRQSLHDQIRELLENRYTGYISVEMSRGADLSQLVDKMRYVKEVFQ